MLTSANPSLDVYGDVERPDDECDDRPHVGLAEAARGQRRRAEADAARVQRALVTGNRVLVHRDAHVLEDPGEEEGSLWISQLQGDPGGLGPGYVYLAFGSALGWWAATIATYCPSRMMEHAIPVSTQPRAETFWVTLFTVTILDSKSSC